MKKIKTAYDKADHQPGNGNAEKKTEHTQQLVWRKTGFDRDWSSPEQIESQGDQRHRDRNQGDESD